ncbi:MAG: GNAT family protein [Candidatus Portnoybacteria bacterium]|nr:GNAT family protein [Candidatus Portnoybacteria bacterium]MDD4982638.1 GNAT family protein [Candidatus Portnoybacteria bacterium]
MFLDGQKVGLRPVREEDASIFQEWMNDPEIIQYLLIYLPITLAAERQWIENTNKSKDSIVLTIVTKTPIDGKPIGNVALVTINKKDGHATLGIVIGDKDYHEYGYGTEAARLMIGYGFNQLNLHRINSSALAFNKRSINMHLKLGFKKEGRQRQKIFKNGKYADEVLFGLLREEWKK